MKAAEHSLHSIVVFFAFAVVSLCACSARLSGAPHSRYLESGSIVISRTMPQPGVIAPATTIASSPMNTSLEEMPLLSSVGELAGPVLGYIPPTLGFLPADNEAWLEVNTEAKSIEVYRGSEKIKQFHTEGTVTLPQGTYALQHKQKRPLWYATDEYFISRQLPVPPAGDRLRYRRGALGSFVLYPTTTFPIHCGPLWSQEVGGLKVSKNDLSSIYYMLPIGATVVVK